MFGLWWGPICVNLRENRVIQRDGVSDSVVVGRFKLSDHILIDAPQEGLRCLKVGGLVDR